MQREINVAFQGGGARLISLIAAAHAIAEMEANSDFKVTAVSGSSAGSIAAFLLASGANFDKLRSSIARNDKKISAGFPQFSSLSFNLRVLLFVLLGKPIYKSSKFNEIFKDILDSVEIDSEKRINEINLKKELHIISSDIYEGKSVTANPNDKIIDALRSSCALPIVFAPYNKNDVWNNIDGGLFDNLPTDILMSETGENKPIFAVGFKSEKLSAPTSPLSYVYTIASSSVQNRVSQSRRMIGEDMVLDLDTELKTLDFNKIVSVGIEKEYSYIKEQTKTFFRSWLQGSGSFRDPHARNKGNSPLLRLRNHERSIINYFEEIVRITPCRNKYIKLCVDANCLTSPNRADEITIEKLVDIPEGCILPAIWQPMTIGDGVLESVECFVRIGGPDGPKVDFTELVIHDLNLPFDPIDQEYKRKPGTVMMLRGDLGALSGKKLYVHTKELIYGFFAKLRESGLDDIGLRSTFWNSDMISLQINAPKQFSPLKVEWIRDGVSAGPQPVEIDVGPDRFRANQVCYEAQIRNVAIGDRLKAFLSRV